MYNLLTRGATARGQRAELPRGANAQSCRVGPTRRVTTWGQRAGLPRGVTTAVRPANPSRPRLQWVRRVARREKAEA